MSKKDVARTSQEIGRRGFLRRAAAVATALVAGVVAAPKPAYTCDACCNLCEPTGTHAFVDCTCTWGWTCIEFGAQYSCEECYGPGGSCTGNCTGVKASRAKFLRCMPGGCL